MAKAPQCFRLDLADSFSGDIEVLADLFQSMV